MSLLLLFHPRSTAPPPPPPPPAAEAAPRELGDGGAIGRNPWDERARRRRDLATDEAELRELGRLAIERIVRDLLKGS